jgi:sugar O-acyltransferase (sialic acid O-acetyltransferase NeuD family)
VTGLVIIAASGLAAEAIAACRAVGRHGDIVILDDNPALRGTSVSEVPVVGRLEDVTRHPHDDVLVCAGHGSVRRTLVHRLDLLGVRPERYARIVHPNVDVPAGCAIGNGTIVMANATLTAAVTIGDHVVIMPNTCLAHDTHVSDFATLCAGVTLGGSVLVGEGAYVGMNASVRQGLSLGVRSTLGMGSVLLEDVPSHETWAGVPAEMIAHREKATAIAPRNREAW